jgi:hypothetical protein
MSLLVRTSTDAGALLVRDTDDPFALAVTESTSTLALRVRESTSPLAMRVRGLFSPASLPGLAAWYDASDSSTVLTTVSPDVPATNGQTVRRWVSRHNPAVFWDQGDLVIQPKLNDPNPGLNFNGTSQFMDGTATMAGVFRDRGYGYIFAVAQDLNPTGGNAVHRVVHFSNNDPAGLFRAAFSTRATTNVHQIGGRRLDADSAVSITGQANSADLHLLDANYLWAAGTLALQRDGSQILTGSFASSGNTSDTASWNVILGRAGGSDGFFPGNIRELIIVNEQLTAAQILSTRRYLQRKWGTPALP